MTLPPEKLADMRVKHLEMLQTVVSRMSGYGASFKSYCVTVTTAVIGFALTLHRPSVVTLALLPIIFFALADAQYLRVERRLRGRFDLVRKQDWSASPSFEIDLEKAKVYSAMARVVTQAANIEVAKARIGKEPPDLRIDLMP